MQIIFLNSTGCEISRHTLETGGHSPDPENVDLMENARRNRNLARDLETLRPGDTITIKE